MLHRITIVVALAVLLCGCSGGEGTVEESASERAVAAASDEVDADPLGEGVESVEPDATVADTLSGEADEPVESTVDEQDDVLEEQPATEPVADPDETYDHAEDSPVGETRTSHLRVIRSYVCKGIEQSEPTEAGKSFVPEDGVLRLCCFSEIAGAGGPDTVYHVWRWGDREMARVELEVKSSRWRTWSTKRILDEWRGEWHVEVTDGAGVVLSRLEFSVE